MKRYYCTYFDRNYLVKGLALIESLNKHEKNNFNLFVICLDEITHVILKKLNLSNVFLLSLHEIEQRDFPLLATKQNRSLVEYYFTVTPTIILYILTHNPEIDVLTYVDADLFFYSSPDPILEELGNNSVLIHEHRFPATRRHLEIFGKYNVGLLCFRNDPNGIKVLNWWRAKCIEWCYNYASEDGKFADQAYLNDWTTRFNGIKVLENIGAGVAPWNHEQYGYGVNDVGNILVNGSPLIFYHFHSLAFVTPDVIIPARYCEDYPLTLEILHLCFIPYVNTLHRQIANFEKSLAGVHFWLSHRKHSLTGTYFPCKKYTCFATERKLLANQD